MTEVLPGLETLKGGQKQHWIDTNLDFIDMLNYHVGFDTACLMLNCKPDTLIKALRKAESQHRPAITQAEKALNRAALAENKAYEAIKELRTQAEILIDAINRQDLVDKILVEGLESQSRLLSLMASAIVNTGSQSATNFTEHINSARKRKVGLTPRRERVRLSISRKARLTLERQSKLSYSDRERLQLSRPLQRVTNQHRFLKSKNKRWRDV